MGENMEMNPPLQLSPTPPSYCGVPHPSYLQPPPLNFVLVAVESLQTLFPSCTTTTEMDSKLRDETLKGGRV